MVSPGARGGRSGDFAERRKKLNTGYQSIAVTSRGSAYTIAARSKLVTCKIVLNLPYYFPTLEES